MASMSSAAARNKTRAAGGRYDPLVLPDAAASNTSGAGAELLELGRDFWSWRAETQPIDRDDVKRIERPAGWTPDWSAPAVAARRLRLQELRERWLRAQDPAAPVAVQVDHRLLGSALARVGWELDTLRGWRRNPVFYVDQTVASVVDVLLPPPPFDERRADDVALRLRAIPATLLAARANLDEAVAPFARLALGDLHGIAARMDQALAALRPVLPRGAAPSLEADGARAGRALEEFRAWLEERVPSLPEHHAVGREAYVAFLRDVALMPFTPEELVAMGRHEYARAAACEAVESRRARAGAPPALAGDVEDQVRRAQGAFSEVAQVLREQELLSLPAGLPGYVYREMPAYLAALQGFGELTDFGAPERPCTSTRWIPPPDPDAGFFQRVMASDPRPHLLHEGLPGHALQLALGHRHPDALRRRWYDSGVNEGLATYAEELLLQAGLFDGAPFARGVVYRFLRLRALRVEVDVGLATGALSVEAAAQLLRARADVDALTAREEAASYAAAPGFAIGYLIGKLQITSFLEEARRQQGESFDLRDFHDFVWLNGNVPIALQRWEHLGLSDQVPALPAR